MAFTFAGEPHCPRDSVYDLLCRSSGMNSDNTWAVQPSVLQEPGAESMLHWSGQKRTARGQRGRELGVRGERGLNGWEESGGQGRARSDMPGTGSWPWGRSRGGDRLGGTKGSERCPSQGAGAMSRAHGSSWGAVTAVMCTR